MAHVVLCTTTSQIFDAHISSSGRSVTVTALGIPYIDPYWNNERVTWHAGDYVKFTASGPDQGLTRLGESSFRSLLGS